MCALCHCACVSVCVRVSACCPHIPAPSQLLCQHAQLTRHCNVRTALHARPLCAESGAESGAERVQFAFADHPGRGGPAAASALSCVVFTAPWAPFALSTSSASSYAEPSLLSLLSLLLLHNDQQQRAGAEATLRCKCRHTRYC